MQRIVVLIVSAASLLFLGNTTLSSSRPRCTELGTMGNDIRAGTQGDDRICLHAGNDYAMGFDGADVIRGGTGHDSLVGGDGPDHLRGGTGNDFLFGVDGHGGDVLNGGPGIDGCFGEPHDIYRHCERIGIGDSYPPKVAIALVNLAGRVMRLGEHYQRCAAEHIAICVGVG
jgi:hypothetical protein